MHRQSALVAMSDFTNVTAFLTYLQQQLAGSLSAFEVMWNDYFHAVTAEGWHRAPLARDYPFYVVFQAEGSDCDDARVGGLANRGDFVDLTTMSQ